MSSLRRDLMYAIHSLLRKPGFAAAALASLALGIGTTTAIFTLLQAIFLHPLPFEELDRLVKVMRTVRQENGEFVGDQPLAFPNYQDMAERNRSFEALGAYHWWPVYLAAGGESQKVIGAFVSGNYFDILRLSAAEGRLIQAEDTEGAGAPVAVLAYGAWQRIFGGDSEVIGQVVQVNSVSLTIVGVAPQGFHGVDLQTRLDVFMPAPAFEQISPYSAYFKNRGIAVFWSIARLRDGVRLEEANDEVMALARQLAGEYPESLDELGAKALTLVDASLRPFDRVRYQGYASRLVLVAVILIIACLNVANLLFVRGIERAREMAVRQAMGAGRGRLLRQLVTENLLLFFFGGLLGLGLTKLFVELLWSFRPPEVPESALDLSLGIEVWGFALAVALAVGMVFGLLPAWSAARTDLMSPLKESEPLGRRRALPRLLQPRSLVVALQVALALVALIGAGLMLRSLQRILTSDLGFLSDELAVISVAPGEQGYDEAATRAFYRLLLDEARALPGVSAAGLSERRLLGGAIYVRSVYLPGAKTQRAFGSEASHRLNAVTPGFFDTVGIELLEGRDFRDQEPGEHLAVIVNKTMAEELWGSPGQAIGQRFTLDYPAGHPSAQPIEVVGVVGDAKYRAVREEPQFFLYRSLAQHLATSMTLHVRTEADPSTILASLRETVRKIDPGLAIADVGTMSSFVDEELWLERSSTKLLGLFGALALALALVGVYALLAYSVNSRRREIAIQVALGAGRGHMLRSVVAESLLVAAAGVVIGLAVAAFALGPVMENQLYGISAIDLSTYAVGSLVLLGAAILGSLLPAWRATRTDAIEVLRAE